jgi:hypothetical protein
MPVNQEIQQFYSTALRKDFARDFLFRVIALKLPGMPAMRDDQLVYVKAANLPGRNISNIPVPYMGLNINVPGGVTYPGSDGYSLSFYADAQNDIRNYLEAASRISFDDTTSTGTYGTPGDDSYIILAQLDKSLEIIDSYKLVGASIRNISDITYSIASGSGATVDVTTTIAYHFYEKVSVS